jgi:hypothetical protein
VTTPSTPLSVVSDLHSYEQSSSLSLMSSTSCPKSSKDNSYITTTNDSKDIQSTPILQLDSSVISSSNTSLNNTSAIIESNEIKVNTEEKDLIDKTLHDFNASEAIAKCQTLNEDKNNQDFNQLNSNNNNNNQNIANSSFEPNNNQIKNESEDVSPNRQNISDDSISSSNNNNNLNQENKTLIDDFDNESKNLNENIENSDNQTKVRVDEEDMSQPMDYCGSNTNTNANSSDFTNKTIESIPDCNIMDETLSQSEQSDQSEPMDED